MIGHRKTYLGNTSRGLRSFFLPFPWGGQCRLFRRRATCSFDARCNKYTGNGAGKGIQTWKEELKGALKGALKGRADTDSITLTTWWIREECLRLRWRNILEIWNSHVRLFMSVMEILLYFHLENWYLENTRFIWRIHIRLGYTCECFRELLRKPVICFFIITWYSRHVESSQNLPNLYTT